MYKIIAVHWFTNNLAKFFSFRFFIVLHKFYSNEIISKTCHDKMEGYCSSQLYGQYDMSVVVLY